MKICNEKPFAFLYTAVVPPTSNASQLQKTVKSMLTEVLTFTWDNGVVHYTIDDSYSDESKKLIDLSIADFVGRMICIRHGAS